MVAPLIDVLLPVHNALATLPEAVEDVLAQERVDLRLLAVVDTHGTGQDDGSGAWLEQRARLDSRLLVLPNTGSGLTDALVTGLAAVTAPLVSHMESDDRCPPQRLASLQAALLGSEAGRSRPLAGVVSQVQAFGAITDGMRRWLQWQNQLLTHEQMSRERFVEIPALHQTGLYRTEAIRGLGGYATGGPWPADIDLWLRWFEADLPLAKLPSALYRWRQHPRQSTRGGGDHDQGPLRSARLAALARLHGHEGRDPRPIQLVSIGSTLRLWRDALETGPFSVCSAQGWKPGQPAPPAPPEGGLQLAVYGMEPARRALRASTPTLTEPGQRLFAG